jgi:hypothetical protein
LLVAILGTALVLVAVEVAARLWLASPFASMPDERYSWVIRPHARVVHSGEGWSVRHANSMGLLDDELRVPRARVRAILLGDSFSEALQVAQEANFQSVAERRVPGLEVINVGHSGRSPAEYADWLEEYGPGLAPDLVIVQVNDWDLADLLSPAALARQAAAAHGQPPPLTPVPPAGRLKRLLKGVQSSSALIVLTRMRMEQIAKGVCTRFEARLRGTRTLPPDTPTPTLVTDPRLPALMDALHRRLVARTPRIIYLYLPSIDYFGPRFEYSDPRVAAFYHEFAASHGATLVDPLDDFRAEFTRTGQPLHGFSNSVMGTGHMNAAGHRVVGELLARAIAKSMR